jgi:hypothetical protein
MIIEKLDKYLMTKQRISDHGEVYTRSREVNAMLDLVKQETERIESRFLEPACGKGNFMVEVLKRKLRIVETRYKKSQIEYERYSVIALSSIYGIDILPDNVEVCRNRLFYLFDEKYSSLFQKKAKNECRDTVIFILSKNIICGDVLTLKTTGENPQPIVFSEWSLVKGSMVKRRDFAFQQLIPEKKTMEPSLFSDPNSFTKSDLGGDVFIPEPVNEYPLTHFLRISDAERAKL